MTEDPMTHSIDRSANSRRTERRKLVAAFVSGSLAVLLLAIAIGAGVTQASNRYDDLSLFASVLSLVRSNYVDEVDEHLLLRSALRGLFSELDPHSSFLDVEAYEEMQIDTRGEFHGLGIEITKSEEDYIQVVAPIDGTPAQRAGIESKDEIASICPTEPPEDWEGEECRGTKDMTLYEAVHLMRGKKGTEITIYILREDFDRPLPFTIVRDVVQVTSVQSRWLDEGYGYLRINSFQERTHEEATESLDKLKSEAPEGLKGLVVDLRDNPGGLLDQAVKISNLWISDGVIVYTQGRHESQRHDFNAVPVELDKYYPIVVLVNGGSASASEIVSGALQDHRRALILGTQTFGKGSVQTVFPLEDESALRLTTALYYTPSGRSIQATGINPDIEVHPLPPGIEDSPQMRRLRERDLLGHFSHNDAESNRDDPGGNGSPDEAEESEATESGEDEPESGEDEPESGKQGDARELPLDLSDRQLARGLEVLKSWTYFEHLRGEPEIATATESVVPAQQDSEPGSGHGPQL
jgi:carboxyl-terminal processing protease